MTATEIRSTTPATQTVTTYDYTVITVPTGKAGLYRDCYEAFGWQIEATKSGPIPGSATSLSLKRPRSIKNRPVVDQLQRRCETALVAIERHERSKTTAATATAYGVGLLGTAAMAIAVFATIGSLAVAMLPFAIVGFALWIAPIALYQVIKSRKTRTADAAIERELQTVYATCEQAGALLA